ncbi:hypothetical protein HOD29_01200 [archaeon]|jgi:hypothetical protein|nr:hypothetical protein [archaeon]
MAQKDLYKPKERVFINEFLMYESVLPGKYMPNKSKLEVQVDILEINDNRALISLPNIATGEQETALIDMIYLN